jgi:hypothetical protein
MDLIWSGTSEALTVLVLLAVCVFIALFFRFNNPVDSAHCLRGPWVSLAVSWLGAPSRLFRHPQGTAMLGQTLVANFFLTFFTMFYFLRDGPSLVQRLKCFSPLADRYEDQLIRRFLTLLDIYGTEFNQQLDLVHHPTGIGGK